MNSTTASHLRLGITSGDPAGIGPEVSLRALEDPEIGRLCRFYVYGDPEILRARAAQFDISFNFETVLPEVLHRREWLPDRAVVRVDCDRAAVRLGEGSKASGVAAAQNIIECASACAEGCLDAMVTAPISKQYLQEAGHPFPGHTEFLAHLLHAPSVAMAFLTDELKVVLATVHLPLRLAIDCITADLVRQRLELMLREFPRLGLPCRRVGVAGMNPHAGEGGLFGSEEREHIEPAIREVALRHPDVEIQGPLPADTLFYRAAQGEFDAVLALYHDQGLGPLKLLGFGKAANVTLGLPFVRTSVDHGTAYEIARSGSARPDSMKNAIRWALRLASTD